MFTLATKNYLASEYRSSEHLSTARRQPNTKRIKKMKENGKRRATESKLIEEIVCDAVA